MLATCELCSWTNYTCGPRHQWDAWRAGSQQSPPHGGLIRAAFKARELYIDIAHLSERLKSADDEGADSETWDVVWAKVKTTQETYDAAIEEWHNELDAYKILCTTKKSPYKEPEMAKITRLTLDVGAYATRKARLQDTQVTAVSTHATTRKARLQDTPVTALGDEYELMRLDDLADALDRAWGF